MAQHHRLTLLKAERTYEHAITEFVDWYSSERRLAFNRTVVLRYRIYLEQRLLAPTTINLRLAKLAAVRRVAYEAADSGLLGPELAAGIRRVKGVRRIGVRLGNLAHRRSRQEPASESRWRGPSKQTEPCNVGFVGWLRTAARRVTRVNVQLREEHWVIADLHGKAGHIRTVPIPVWVKQAIDGWTIAGGITDGRIFRSINKAGKTWGDGMTPKMIREVVKQAAQAAGIEKLAPHDVRRTCARLCHLAGGELDRR